MAQLILGLDLGAHAVKGVLLESTYRGYMVVDAGMSPVAPAGDEAQLPLAARQAAAVRALLEGRGWRPDATIAAFPGPAGSSHVVTLPFTDPRRIEQTIGFEVEGQIPFSLDEVAWDWQPLGTRGAETDLYVGVVKKEDLAVIIAALAEAGVDPRVVIPAAPAYAALAANGAIPAPDLGPVEPGALTPADVVIDVGHERTSVCVVGPDGAEAARTFGFGSAHLARVLARDLGVPPLEAAALAAGAPDARAADALARGLAPLARELRATLRAWRARVGARPVRRVLLAGQTGTLAALPELLAPEVEGAPVSPLALAGPPAEKIAPEDAPSLALALALALRGHQGSHAPRLNLRRGALAYTRDFEHVKGRVGRLGVYAGLVLLLAILSAGVRLVALSRQERTLDDALCDAEQKTLGKCYGSFEEAQAVLRGRGTPAAAIPHVSAVDVFAELAERVPADVPLRFDRIEVTKDKLHLQGTTDAAENVDRIVSALHASRCFGDARSGGARRRASDNKFEFSIDSGIGCLETGPAAPGGRG
jgi:general secretion pathway protein L